MSRNQRKTVVRLVEKEYINNQRLVEYLANKYIERKFNNEIQRDLFF
jgi:hypothetical protein